MLTGCRVLMCSSQSLCRLRLSMCSRFTAVMSSPMLAGWPSTLRIREPWG